MRISFSGVLVFAVSLTECTGILLYRMNTVMGNNVAAWSLPMPTYGAPVKLCWNTTATKEYHLNFDRTA